MTTPAHRRFVARVIVAIAAAWLITGCSSGQRPQTRQPREAGAAGTTTETARPTDRPTSTDAPGTPAAPAPRAGAPAIDMTTAAPLADRLESRREIHDPTMIRHGDWYYIYATGAGLPIHRSRDLVHWERVGRVFRNDVPAWAKQEIPTSIDVWAPDIKFVNGRYVLTYTVATFGQNRSIIGMASSPTLDPAERGYAWRNDGKVFESFVENDYNAIDSNLFVSPTRAALFFGSHWSGIKMIELDRTTLKPIEPTRVVSIARRESGGVEAPYVVERNGWYYLFVSFDKCCSGVDSTYNIRVGRARNLEGPYYDRDNKLMMRGGGTPVLATSGRMIGPGHCAVYQDGGTWYLVYHFYDGEADGARTLQIRELLWDHLSWPRAGQVVGGL